MKLLLDSNDLKPEFLNRTRDPRPDQTLYTMDITFEMFLPTSQQAIRAVGFALYSHEEGMALRPIYPSN